MHQLRVLILSSTVIACGMGVPKPNTTPIPAPPAANDDPTTYSAVVSQKHARFVFPPIQLDTFVWWSPETRTQLTTYSWDVLIHAPDKTYAVGYWLPAVGFETYARWYTERRAIPQGTQRGTLSDLLQAGMQDARELQGHIALLVSDEGVQVVVEHRRIVVDVRGKETVRRLFALRPSHVTFYQYLPNQPIRVAHVAVVYKDWRAAEQSGR
jgi:hypothetical protein